VKAALGVYAVLQLIFRSNPI